MLIKEKEGLKEPKFAMQSLTILFRWNLSNKKATSCKKKLGLLCLKKTLNVICQPYNN